MTYLGYCTCGCGEYDEVMHPVGPPWIHRFQQETIEGYRQSFWPHLGDCECDDCSQEG